MPCREKLPAFFILKIGINHLTDIDRFLSDYRKCLINLSLELHNPITELYKMSILDVYELIKDYSAEVKRRNKLMKRNR